MQGNPSPTWENIGTIPTLLSNIGNLTSAGLIEHTGSGAVLAVPVSALAKTLLDDTNQDAMRSTLGGTTIGKSFFTLSNPSAITFPRINANNTVTARSSADFLTDIGAAATIHTHLPTVIALTPINSFTGVNGNNLVVFPALGLAIIFFSIARTSIPADATNIFSWSSSYTSLDNTRLSAFGVGAGSIDNLHLYLTGNTLKFYKLSGPATAYDIIEGQIMFRYTP